jgi:hypothetical protein
MSKEITISNIKSYLEGNGQRILEELKLQPSHIKEQIVYRRLLCKDDCAKTNKCIKCGCDFKGKTSVVKSCNNGERFPDLMGKSEWEEFKKDKNIE